MQTKGFETVEDSTSLNFKSFRFLFYFFFFFVLLVSHVRTIKFSNETLSQLKRYIYLFIYLFRFWLFSLLSEFSGDSEESAMIPAKSSAAVLKVKTPPKAEIEEFFAMAEKYEQKRFTEK